MKDCFLSLLCLSAQLERCCYYFCVFCGCIHLFSFVFNMPILYIEQQKEQLHSKSALRIGKQYFFALFSLSLSSVNRKQFWHVFVCFVLLCFALFDESIRDNLSGAVFAFMGQNRPVSNICYDANERVCGCVICRNYPLSLYVLAICKKANLNRNWINKKKQTTEER